MRWLAAALGVVVLILLAIGGLAVYRAVERSSVTLPPEPSVRPEVVPPPKKVVSPQPKVAEVKEEPITCPIIPVPKVYKESGRTAELLGPGEAAIVIGGKATEPERYAAERFQGLVERRFRRRLPILGEGEPSQGVRQVVLLGQRATHAWLDRLCGEKHIDLSAESPGHDGFAIEVLDDVGGVSPRRVSRDGDVPPTVRQAILIGGSNDRGVIYGQHAFFDLLRQEEGKVVFPVVLVRDWPSIAWRGRPDSLLREHLSPGVMDVYARGRLNFIDVRDNGGKRAMFGFPPGSVVDKAAVGQIIREAHRRGIFVYGTVSCGRVGRDQVPDVLATYGQLIALGVDGLWVSFDDPGPSEGAEGLVARILELGTRHGMTGMRIATTPPMGSYERIPTEFNLRLSKVPGFADARWFFTRVPCAGDAEQARRVGLSRLPSWWHNWPRPAPGLLHAGRSSAENMRVDTKTPCSGVERTQACPNPSYLELLPLSAGWGAPDYAALHRAPQHIDAVMCWNTWAEEYCVGVLGIWAWHPERHSWARTRQAVYTFVFGPSLAAAAQEFDERLARLKPLFILPQPPVVVGLNWPPRLGRAEDRPEALRLVDEMDARLQRLEASAPAQTSTDPARLGEVFLEPMRATVTYARKMAEWDSPAPGLAQLEERLLEQLAYGEAGAAEAEFHKARGPLLAQVEHTEAALGKLAGVAGWLATLRPLLASFSAWPALAEQRQKEIGGRFEGFLRGRQTLAKHLAGLARPPEGRALAEVRPGEWLRRPVLARGLWTAGLVKGEGFEALAIAHPRPGGWVPIEPGQYGEVRAEVPVPKFEGRLGLQVLLMTPTEPAPPAPAVAELWANGKRLLEHDTGLAGAGAEWLNVDATGAVKGQARLTLRFRVSNRRHTDRFESIVCLGLVRLVAEDSGKP